MQIPLFIRQKFDAVKAYLEPIISSAKFKRFFPLIVIVVTITMVGSVYALYNVFALSGGRITVAECIASPADEPVFRQIWVRANPGTSVEAYVYPRSPDGTYRTYKQTSPANPLYSGSKDGQAYFRYFFPVDADIEVFGIAGGKAYFEDKGVVTACPAAAANPQPDSGNNAGGGNSTAPTAAAKQNPDGTDCHTYTLRYDPNYSYPCVTHLQKDLGISADGIFGAGTLNSVRSFQGSHGLTADGIVGPGTWCKIHTDLPGCAGGTPSSSTPAPTAAAKQNPDGTDCHTYILKYDPNYAYPCVKHLQNDLGISADGIFGSNTQSSVKSFQSSHGLTADGIVGPGTWCKIHTDLPGCTAAPAPQVNHDPVGFVDNVNCQHVSGWFDDPDNKPASIEVHVYIDNTGYNTGPTSVYRADVNASPAYGIGSGNHGFDWLVPAQWLDGKQHNVTVYGINIGEGGNNAVGKTLGPCSAPSQPVDNASHGVQVIGVASNRCIDVPSQNFSNGVSIQLYDCNGSRAQQWNFLSNNTIQAYANKCLDVSGGNTANGASVIIWDCHGQSNQQWRRNSDQTIRSVQTGKCLDAADYGTGNGTRLQTWDCTGGSNQKWR